MEENRVIFRIDFEGQEKILEQLAAIRGATEQLKEENKELAKDAKQGNLEAGKALEGNRIQITKNNKEIRELSKQYEVQTGAMKQNTGSLTEMRAQLGLMTKAYDNLSSGQRENAAVGGAMQQQINALSKEIGLAEQKTGRFQRNVGNYQAAVDTANMSIREMQLELKALRKVPLDNLKPEEIMQVEMAMGKLTDALGDAQARVRVHAMEDLPAMVASLQGVVAASQVAVGTFALFGVEDERLQKLTHTMVQLMGVAQALQTVQQLIATGEAKALAIRMKSIAVDTAKTVGTKALAAATWLYNGALIATRKALKALGIGYLLAIITAVIAGVVLLVKNFDRIIERFREFGRWLGIGRKETESLADTNERLIKSNDRLLNQMAAKSKALDFEIRMLKALGSSEDEIIAKQREALTLRVEEARVMVQNNALLLQQKKIEIDAYEESRTAYTAAMQDLQIFEAERIRASRERAEQVQKESEQERQRLNELAQQRRKEAEQLKQLELERQARDEKARLELAALQAKTEEDRINARIELLKWETEQELANAELTQNERLLIEAESIEKQLDLENELLQRKIDQQRAFDEQEKERQAELDQFEADLQAQKFEREKAQAQAQAEFEREITDARIDTAWALTDAMKTIGGEQTALYKAAKAIQKTIALVEIGINLQRELTAISVAAAVMDAALPGSGRIYAITQRIRAVTQSLASAARVMAMNTGGVVPGVGTTDTVPAMLTPGEGVLRKQAMESRRMYTLTGTPKQIASQLNQAYGGVEFRNAGGIIGNRAIEPTRNAMRELNNRQLIEAFRQVQIITTIEDINAGLAREAIRNQMATY